MTEEVEGLIRELRERARAVDTFIADYSYAYNLQSKPFEATGGMYFLSPDRFRSETSIGNRRIITIRKGTMVQRHLKHRNEVWKYNLNDVPQTQPINFGIANLKDAFFAVDETTLVYKGMSDFENICTYVFHVNAKNWAGKELLDTRKGFSIKYQPKNSVVGIKLSIDCERGLLLNMIGNDATGTEVFQTNYFIREVNIALDESIFVMDESSADYKVIDVTDVLLSSMNPDEADSASSPN